MNRRVMVIAFALTVMMTSGEGWGQNLIGGIYWGPNPGRRVTLSQNGNVVATLLLPDGTFMSATYNNQPQQNLVTAGRWELRGDVVLRVQPAATSPGEPPGRRTDFIMSNPPITLRLSMVDVLIENVSP